MQEYLKVIYDICEGISLAYIVLGVLGLGFLLAWGLNFYVFASIRLSFLLRWARAILLFCYVYIILVKCLSLVSYTPILLSGLIVIWLELSYVYLRAYMYSKRNILPFSSFVACENAWRPNREFYELKREIESAGFAKVASYKATNSLCLATLFYSESDNIALLVLFRLENASLKTIYYFISKKSDDKYLVFSNDSTEDMLFLKAKYDMNYSILSSFKSLFVKHKAKISKGACVDFSTEIVDLPHSLSRDNAFEAVALGLYNKDRARGQLLSGEGKFQFCKKLIMNKYFRI